jgi:tetratricopeptide (TPR) repeat protein
MADCPIEVHHYPKSKDRNGYLPLLKLGVEEDPADDRLAHYFARELWYKGEHRRAIAEFHRHLALPSAKWVPERAASMVFMAHCHQALGKPELARGWLLRACAEDPESREPWLEFANFCLAGKDMAGAYWGARRALEITRRTGAYTEHERSWREGPHDVLSVAAWYLGHRKEALKHVNIAISLAPFDQRICRNHAMMEGIEAGQ